MTFGEWALVVGFGASVLFVGAGWLAFWPEWPARDDTPLPGDGRHRKARKQAERAARSESPWESQDLGETPQTPPPPLAPENLAPMADPQAESWMWSAGRPAARHRYEHLAEGTQRLTWPPEDEDAPEPS